MLRTAGKIVACMPSWQRLLSLPIVTGMPSRVCSRTKRCIWLTRSAHSSGLSAASGSMPMNGSARSSRPMLPTGGSERSPTRLSPISTPRSVRR